MRSSLPKLHTLFFLMSILTFQPALAEDDQSGRPSRIWESSTGKPRAVFLCLHDIRLNNAAYEDFGRAVSKQEITCISTDLPGFGSFQDSEPYNFWSTQSAMAGLKDTMLFARKKISVNVPLILIGEGLGAAIAIKLADKNAELIDGVILVAPGVSKSLFDDDSFASNITSIQQVKHRILADPFTRRTELGAAERKDLIKLCSDQENIDLQRLGVEGRLLYLVLQGKKDSIVNPVNTYTLFSRIAGASKKYIESPQSEHLVLEYGQFDSELIALITDWAKNTVKVKKTVP